MAADEEKDALATSKVLDATPWGIGRSAGSASVSIVGGARSWHQPACRYGRIDSIGAPLDNHGEERVVVADADHAGTLTSHGARDRGAGLEEVMWTVGGRQAEAEGCGPNLMRRSRHP
jgi:hypothetical protein